MKKLSKQEIQLYAVIGLSVVFVILAYLRFGHKPDSPTTGNIDTVEATATDEDPELAAWLATASSIGNVTPAPYVQPSRDLFAPVNTMSSGQKSGRHNRAHLSAVVSGQDGKLAIINNQILGVGERLGTLTVIEIGASHAVLNDGETRLVIQVGE